MTRYSLTTLLFASSLATACKGGDDGHHSDDSSHGADSSTDDSDDPVDEDKDGDGSLAGDDCDDEDDSAYPGATEICDGVDNNCDSAVDESQLACYNTTDGTFDFATKLSEATKEKPATIVLDFDGRLELGEGEWYGGLEINANVDITGAGSGKTVFLGGGIITPLVINDNGTSGYGVDVSGVSFAEGKATRLVGDSSAGGAVFCASTALVDEAAGTARTVASFFDVVIRDSVAGLGGGLYSGGCTIHLTNSAILDNSVGDTGLGGGVYTATTSPVYMVDSQVVGNSAKDGGNLFIKSAFVCDVVSDSAAGVRSGVAVSLGGGLFLSDGSIDSNGCDWGSEETADDNTANGSPQDIAVDGVPTLNASTESFYCDAGNACTLDD